MQTIAMVSRKGGTGKSTLAIGLALAAMERGHKVCLLDADPLGTVWNWRRRRTALEPLVEAVHDGGALVQRIHALAQRGTTLTIIDTAGGWNEVWPWAVGVADLCLIPARPSPADIEAAAPALPAIRAGGKPFAFVLTQTPVRSQRLGGAATTLGATAAALDLIDVVATPSIAARNDQQDALGLGLGVTEYAGSGKSADEMRRLWQWVAARLAVVAPSELDLAVAAEQAANVNLSAANLPAVAVPATVPTQWRLAV